MTGGRVNFGPIVGRTDLEPREPRPLRPDFSDEEMPQWETLPQPHTFPADEPAMCRCTCGCPSLAGTASPYCSNCDPDQPLGGVA